MHSSTLRASFTAKKVQSLWAHNQLAQLGDRRWRAREQAAWERPVCQDFIPDLRAQRLVVAEPGEILQPQVAVLIDLGALQPRREIPAAPAVGAQQVKRRFEAHLRQ